MTGFPPRDLIRAIDAALKGGPEPAQVAGSAKLSGGCISAAARLTLTDGTDAFVKWNLGAPLDMFSSEAAGLNALRERTGLRVPGVLGLGTAPGGVSWLLLEFIPAGAAGEEFASRLARGLVDLHRPSAGACGWREDNYVGSLSQANGLSEDWASFWWLRRLEPQLRLANRQGALRGDRESWRILERGLASLLEDVPAETASLLHGDLWSGNVYASTEGEPVVIDPSVYRGHAEVDLAMTELFGGFSPQFYEAYEQVTPLSSLYAAGRRDLYQLYPLLVHVNLFGASYEPGVRVALARVLQML